MATTFTKILIPFIFSTKNRDMLIAPEIEPLLHAYMVGIARNCDCWTFAINGMPDHVHMFVSLDKKIMYNPSGVDGARGPFASGGGACSGCAGTLFCPRLLQVMDRRATPLAASRLLTSPLPHCPLPRSKKKARESS